MFGLRLENCFVDNSNPKASNNVNTYNVVVEDQGLILSHDPNMLQLNQQQEKVHEAMHLQKLQGLDPLEETNNVVIVGEQTGNISTTKLPN